MQITYIVIVAWCLAMVLGFGIIARLHKFPVHAYMSSTVSSQTTVTNSNMIVNNNAPINTHNLGQATLDHLSGSNSQNKTC